MEKYIYDHTNGWWYELVGDYYLPYVHSEDPTTKPDCHTSESHTEVQPIGTRNHHSQSQPCRSNFASEPRTEEQLIGTWGMRHLTHLRTHSPSAYREFLRNGKLNSYLAEINTSAQAMFDRLVIQLAKSQGITEALKAQDQMEWVRSMNAIRHTAEEIVLSEVIYA